MVSIRVGGECYGLGAGAVFGDLLGAWRGEKCTTMGSRKKRHRRNPRDNPHGRTIPHQTRAADAMTVAWTVTVTTLVICEFVGLAAVLYVRTDPQAEGARTLAGLAQFCALVLAVVSLVLMAVVLRTRRVRPPAGYLVFATVAAAVPFVTAVWSVVQ